MGFHSEFRKKEKALHYNEKKQATELGKKDIPLKILKAYCCCVLVLTRLTNLFLYHVTFEIVQKML